MTQPSDNSNNLADGTTRITISAILDLIGIAAIVVGLWWLAPWCGMVALGLGCVIVALAIDPPAARNGEITLVDEQPQPQLQQPGNPPVPTPAMEWNANQ